MVFKCRERAATYSARLQVSCQYKVNNGESAGTVMKTIADIPIMVKVRTGQCQLPLPYRASQKSYTGLDGSLGGSSFNPWLIIRKMFHDSSLNMDALFVDTGILINK